MLIMESATKVLNTGIVNVLASNVSNNTGLLFPHFKLKGTAKTGRRAQQKSANPPDAPDFEASVENSPKVPKSRQPAGRQEPDEPPKPSRVSGWGEDNPRKSRKLGEGFENIEDSKNERLRPRTPEDDNESDTDIPVIPDLEEQQDDDMTVKVAIAPNVAVNRVATYRELDNDLLRQAAFTTLDNDIDLKLLTKNLSTEADLIEEDKPWDWDRLFTEVTSELLSQLDTTEETSDNQEINQTV